MSVDRSELADLAARVGDESPRLYPPRRSGLTRLALATALLSWASAFVGIRAGLQGYSPGQVALLRYLVASLLLIGPWLMKRCQWPARRDWPIIALTGLLGISLYNVALNT